MYQCLIIVITALVIVAIHFLATGRRERKAAERRRLKYVKMTGRTGRLHGMDEQLFRATAEKRNTWTRAR